MEKEIVTTVSLQLPAYLLGVESRAHRLVGLKVRRELIDDGTIRTLRRCGPVSKGRRACEN